MIGGKVEEPVYEVGDHVRFTSEALRNFAEPMWIGGEVPLTDEELEYVRTRPYWKVLAVLPPEAGMPVRVLLDIDPSVVECGEFAAFYVKHLTPLERLAFEA